MSPVKDLEQPLSISFSSSAQIGGTEEKTGGRVEEEEGREESEEVDAELNAPSPPFTFSNHSPSLSASSQLPSGAPPQASSPAPSLRSMSAPGSGSMMSIRVVPVVSCFVTFWQDELKPVEFWVVLSECEISLESEDLSSTCAVQAIQKEDSKRSLKYSKYFPSNSGCCP